MAGPDGRQDLDSTVDHSVRADAAAPATEGGASGLIVQAMPLLQLMARLRSMATQPDPAALRDGVEAELERFATRTEAAGVPPDQRARAQYALCASLDDLVLTTPWGAQSAWARQTLVMQFQASVGPGRFFALLRQAEEKIGQFRPVLELMYVCLSLGVMEEYRTAPDGAATVQRLRTQAGDALGAGAPGTLPPFAARWQGVAAPFTPGRRRLPVWVAASAGLAALAAFYIGLSVQLNNQSDTLFARMLAAPPSHMPEVTRQPVATPPPPAPPPTEPTLADRLRSQLAAAGPVELAGTAATPILRIPDRALFAGNAAVLAPDAGTLVRAVAQGLQQAPGRFRVVGYTDDRPLHTVLFPSAFRLAAAQAQAVRTALVRAGLDEARVAAEGRASADPVASNATADGRERNRRVEIVIEPAEAPVQ